MKRTIGIAAGMILLAAACVYLLLPKSLDHDWPTSRFSSQAWKLAAPKDRYSFVKDLIASSALVGKDAKEVEEMLGVPSYRAPGDNYWLYIVREAQLGEYGFSAVVMMDISFGEAGKVSTIRLRTD